MSIEARFSNGSSKIALKRAVYDAYLRRPGGQSKQLAIATLADQFKISESTVTRYIRELKRYGDAGAPKVTTQGRQRFAWSDEALAFMRSVYLAATKQVGDCTMRNAYRITISEAQKFGWKTGSESSAYKYLQNISPALLDLAKGGTRALDNKFWILRDLTLLRPFQIVVGDQHRFDFWCIDPNETDPKKKYFRPECYVWLDMRTRLVYGLAFDKHYNASTVVRALRVGVEHFGKFEITYNDNGSSEKSAWSDLVVEQLQTYGMQYGDDIANLYKDQTTDQYIVRDVDGEIVTSAKDASEWHKKNRRIFAKVKNAKTKPIERFFSTLELMLRDQCLPGYIKELNLSAPEEEQATHRLTWQKDNNFLLTFEQFMYYVAKAVDTYNNRFHSSLKRSPVQELDYAVKNGFRQAFLNKDDIEYIFFNRAYAIVQGDRVRLNGKLFVSAPLTQAMVLQNKGTLVALNKKKVELRYNPDNLEQVYAIDPRNNEAIRLFQVEAIDMLNFDQVREQIANKRSQIKATTQAFKSITGNAHLLQDSRVATPFLQADKDVLEDAGIPNYALPQDTTDPYTIPDHSIEAKLSKEIKSKPNSQPVFLTERDRYEALLIKQLNNQPINDKDEEFMLMFEENMDDEDMIYIEQIYKNHNNG